MFDVVLPTEIPDKGRVLTGLSGFWFARTRDLVANHLLALRPDGRSTECRRLQMLPIECVVRGYLAGSGWKDYQRTGATSGHRLPEGMAESERLPEPIFTPATKARKDTTRTSIARGGRRPRRRDLLARGRAGRRSRSTGSAPSTPRRAASSSRTRSSSSARTATGGSFSPTRRLTPDSSRFWPADEYEPGRAQPSFDKQFVRDYAEALGWDKTIPAPSSRGDVVDGTRRRYVEAFERITGISFDAYVDDPTIVLR